MSNNARQYYSLLCIVYRDVGILGIFKSQRGNFVAGAGGRSDYPRTPQDTPGHPRIPQDAFNSYIIHLFTHLFIH